MEEKIPRLQMKMHGSQKKRELIPLGDGPELILPCKEEDENEDAENKIRPIKSAPDSRRKSVVTEDGHEIVFSGLTQQNGEQTVENPTPERRRNPVITADGHEIVICSKGEPTVEKAVESKLPEDEYVSRGGSCIVSPLGDVLTGPLWEDEDGLLTVDVDFDDFLRGRLDLAVGGSYSK